jgi:hypothetical protein
MRVGMVVYICTSMNECAKAITGGRPSSTVPVKLKLKIYLSFTHDSIYMFDDLTLLFPFE